MKRMILLLGVLAGFVFSGNTSWAEQKIITNDYSQDPNFIFVRDKVKPENHRGDIVGAYYSIPSTEYGSVTQEFDISFQDIRHYGWVSVGLASREYVGEMRIQFNKSDDDNDIKGARGRFLFKNEEGIPVQTVTDCPFDSGRTYHIKMEYRKGDYVQVIVSGKDEEGLLKLWDSGRLKVTGKANFNRVSLGVNSNDIHYAKDSKDIYFRGGSRIYFLTGSVDNMVVKYGE